MDLGDWHATKEMSAEHSRLTDEVERLRRENGRLMQLEQENRKLREQVSQLLRDLDRDADYWERIDRGAREEETE